MRTLAATLFASLMLLAACTDEDVDTSTAAKTGPAPFSCAVCIGSLHPYGLTPSTALHDEPMLGSLTEAPRPDVPSAAGRSDNNDGTIAVNPRGPNALWWRPEPSLDRLEMAHRASARLLLQHRLHAH